MSIAFIFGTRPEIIKLSPVIYECIKRKIPHFIIHTNQHYSIEMDRIFIEELELPKPRYHLGISSEKHHGAMIGKMLIQIEKVLMDEKPKVVLVQGDTNTTLAGALAASKLGIRVAHVEAGLRSYDRSMPEEINRVITDHVSDFLFVPTQKQKNILLNEGVNSNKVHIVGNTIVDAVLKNLTAAEKKSINPPRKPYILLTMHRPSNVDDKTTLAYQIKNLVSLSKKLKMPIIYPIHPRTRKQLKLFNIKFDSNYIKLVEPVGFLKMLVLEKHASLIITDSGGLQEESCILKKPCITLRDNTERPETLEVGSNMLVGSDRERLLKNAEHMLRKTPDWENPFGDGSAGKKILDHLV